MGVASCANSQNIDAKTTRNLRDDSEKRKALTLRGRAYLSYCMRLNKWVTAESQQLTNRRHFTCVKTTTILQRLTKNTTVFLLMPLQAQWGKIFFTSCPETW